MGRAHTRTALTLGVAAYAGAVYKHRSSRADTQQALVVSPAVTIAPDTAVTIKAKSMRTHMEQTLYRLVYTLERLVRYLSRFLTVSVIASPLVALGPATYLLGNTSVGPRMESVTMDYICWALGFLGPAFIKMAQWASSRPDIYSPLVIEKLSKFQDNVHVKHSTDIVERTLTDAFGASWREKLSIDMENPIGTGCIAQVFRGIFEEAGEKVKVAIKVIHPHVESMIKTDMEILAGVGNLMDMVPLLEMLSLGESCRQFGKVMQEQLDMTVEARNLSKFASKWGNGKFLFAMLGQSVLPFFPSLTLLLHPLYRKMGQFSPPD